MRCPPSRALLPPLLALVVLGCFPAHDPAKRRVIEDVLQDRARHLDQAVRARMTRSLLHAESAHGVDALLLLAVIEQESHYRPRARGQRGALGLMQVRPSTAREVADRHGIKLRNDRALHDPATNIPIGAAYLAELKRKFGSWELALTAYNRGPRKVREIRARGGRVPARYANRVLRRYRGFQARHEKAGAQALVRIATPTIASRVPATARGVTARRS